MRIFLNFDANMNMVDYIKDLLRFHDYVVIPEFGGFISHYESAKRNMATSTISAPSKRIAFNESLKENDGVLVNYLKSQKGWSLENANSKIADFKIEIEEALQSNGEYEFAGIGKLQLSNSGSLQFHPVLKENLLLNSYGLERVVAQPILRIKEAFEEQQAIVVKEFVEAKNENIQPLHQEQVYQPWYFRAAAVIGIGFLMTTIGMSLFNGNLSGEQLSLLPVQQSPRVYEGIQSQTLNIELDQLKVSDVHLYEAVKVVVEAVPESTSVVEKAIDTKVISNSTTTYQIIVGSFLNETRMNREIATMQSKGFIVKTIEGPNGYTRVALVFDANTTSKHQKLQEIRASVNADAWMLGA